MDTRNRCDKVNLKLGHLEKRQTEFVTKLDEVSITRCINWWLNMDTYSLRGEKLHVFPQTYILTKLMNIMCRFQLIKWNIGPTFWYKAINMVYCKIFNESLSQYLYNLWINCVTAFAFECQYKLGFNLLLNSKYKCILCYIYSHLNVSIFLFYGTIFFSVFKSDDRQYARGCLWT